ncbi:DISP1 family protein [Megaselia abdita]
MLEWYYVLLVKRPFLVVVAVGVLCSACIIVSLTTKDFPDDFTDPTLGFEARGTAIGKRIKTMQNLLSTIKPSGKLVANPNDLLQQKLFKKQFRKKLRDSMKKKKEIKPEDFGIIRKFENVSYEDRSFAYGSNATSIDTQDRFEQSLDDQKKLESLTHSSPSKFFCDLPRKEFTHFVVERYGPNATDSLFDINAFHAMCQLDETIQSVSFYQGFCEREYNGEDCCRSWSISNYIALLSNKTSCFDITEEDVEAVHRLLFKCYPYFRSRSETGDCNFTYGDDKCLNDVPNECLKERAVYGILEFLTDNDFQINSTVKTTFLKYSIIMVPVAQKAQLQEIFYEWESADLSNDIVKVVAFDLGEEFKNELFNELLLADHWLIALGFVFVMACMWIYTSSIFITVMTVVAVLFSLGSAYFLYVFVLQISFFPFMNLLAIVVIIGIGADDAFIFVKIWQTTSSDRNKAKVTQQSSVAVSNSDNVEDMQFQNLISGKRKTSIFKSAYSFISTFLCRMKKSEPVVVARKNPEVIATVTLENADETVVKDELDFNETLPGLMGKTLKHSALSMFVTSFTTAAAFFVSYLSNITAIRCFGIFAGLAIVTNYLLMITWLPACVSIMERLPSHYSKLISPNILQKVNKSFYIFGKSLENFLIKLVIKLPWLWLAIFGIIGIISGVIVFYKPGLKLPSNNNFQNFVSSHPLEVYELKFKHLFPFEKSDRNTKMPLFFIWGVKAVDDGDLLDPKSKGTLHYDNNFSISSNISQIWLQNFCYNLKKQSFYQNQVALFNIHRCFMENFINYMQKDCTQPMTNESNRPCCKTYKFPFDPHIFDLCLPLFVSDLHASKYIYSPSVGGPKFQKNPQRGKPPLVKALIIDGESNYTMSASYTEVKQFVTEVETWFYEELKTAPLELQGGWFTSYLDFYDLQDTLTHGITTSIYVTMGVSMLLLFIVTVDFRISFFAAVTVIFSIVSSVGILVLMEWKLNILESVAITTAVGLAVDFSLHIGVHYRFSHHKTRKSSVNYTMTRILGPTAMAALTTGVAGALMVFSNVLPYRQIGIFLVVIMSVSWLFATLFLTSLLRVAGPHGWSSDKSKPSDINEVKPVEMESLATNSLLKPSNTSINPERAFNRVSINSKDDGSTVTMIQDD